MSGPADGLLEQDVGLLIAALAEDPDRVRSGWRSWSGAVDPTAPLARDAVDLLPLVQRNLHRHGIVDPLSGRLAGVARKRWYQTERLLAAARHAVLALLDAGVDAVAVRGAAVRAAIHPVALRPLADLDLLVPETELDAGVGVLMRAGFALDGFSGRRAPGRLAADHRRLAGSVRLRRDPAVIVLHGRARADRPAASVPLTERLRMTDIGGVPAPAVDPLASLALASAQARVAGAPLRPLRRFADLALLARSLDDGVDLTRLEELVSALDGRASLAADLDALRRLVGPLLPAPLDRWVDATRAGIGGAGPAPRTAWPDEFLQLTSGLPPLARLARLPGYVHWRWRLGTRRFLPG